MRTTILLIGVIGASASVLHRSRVLALRGGGGGTVLAPRAGAVDPRAGAVEEAAPPAALQLKVAACAPLAEGSSRVMLGSAAYSALNLTAGDMVRVRKMRKANFWSSVADQTIGTAEEDPEQEAGCVRVHTKDVRELRLKMGEDVLVAPLPRPVGLADASSPDGSAGNRQPVRRRNGFFNNYMIYRMLYGGPRYSYGGYGGIGGYGGYGRRSYGSRAYGRYSRRGGSMGGRGGRRR